MKDRLLIYQHYKGGLYKLLHWGNHTETGELVAIYEDTKGKVWVRPVSMFEGTVEVDGEKVKRFKLLGGFDKQ